MKNIFCKKYYENRPRNSEKESKEGCSCKRREKNVVILLEDSNRVIITSKRGRVVIYDESGNIKSFSV